MISKELLSEVMGIHIYGRKKVAQTSIIRYEFDDIGERRDGSINTYELMHLCKEWALLNDYSCMSRPRLFGGWLSELMGDYGVEDTQFDADSEPEAVFKACQWILENKDK
jgi:hypothetical protein